MNDGMDTQRSGLGGGIPLDFDELEVATRLRLFGFIRRDDQLIYLWVLRAMDRLRAAHVAQAHTDDIAAVLADLAHENPDAPAEIDNLRQRLDNLADDEVLHRLEDPARAGKLAQYRNRQSVYQFSELGYLAYQAVLGVLAARVEDANLSRLVFSDILRDFEGLAAANRAADNDEIVRRLGSLDRAVQDMAQRTARFHLTLGDITRGTDTSPETFLRYKDALLTHLNNFVVELDRAPEVDGLHSAGTSTAAELYLITRPSGAVAAQISYDTTLGRVQSVTDDNGGVWGVGTPSVQGTAQVFRSAVLGSSPSWYYPLGDASPATAASNEINSGSGTYSPSVTLGESGEFVDATSAGFDGSSSYVTLPSGILDDHFDVSVAMWFKTSTPDGVLFSHNNAAVSAGSTTANYEPWLYVGSDGKLVASVGAGGSIESSTTVDTGVWHYLVFAVSQGSQALYLDGKLVGTGTPHVDSVGENNVYVGTGYLGGSWPDEGNSGDATATLKYFGGDISDVGIWTSTLSDETATSLYAAGKNSHGLTPVESVTVTDPGSNTEVYQYDPENSYREVSYTDGRGNTTTYGYDTSGFLNTTTDPNGNVTTTGHDIRGNETSETTCQDTATDTCSTKYWTYYPDDTSGQLTPSPENDQPLTYRDPRSSSSTDTSYETQYTYNSCGEKTGVTTPSVSGYSYSRTTTTVYTTGSSSTTCGQAQLAYGSTTVYSPAGLVASVTTPGGATTTYRYYGGGSLQSETSPLGEVTSYTYDGLGRVVSKTISWKAIYSGTSTPSSATTTYIYNTDGLLSQETDPVVTDAVSQYTHEKVTAYSYTPDELVHQVQVSDAGTGDDTTRTTTTQYTPFDQVWTVEDPAGDTTTYAYDAFGRKQYVTDPDGNEYEYSYDADGNLTQTDLLNYTGNPNNPSATTTLVLESRAYDPADRLQSVTDSMGRTTSYTYTDNGLIASIFVMVASFSVIYVDGQWSVGPPVYFVTESDSYDAAGDLVEQITNNGATETEWTYDADGRKTSEVQDPSGVNRETAYTYTADDKVSETQVTATASTMTITTTYTYDLVGDVLTEAVSGDGTTRTTTTTYDTRGLAETVENPDAQTWTYYYDGLGQRIEAEAPSVTATVFSPTTLTVTAQSAVPTTLYGYDTFGEVAETQDPDGNVTTTT